MPYLFFTFSFVFFQGFFSPFASHKTAPHKTAPRKSASHKTAPRKTAPRKSAPRKSAPNKTAPIKSFFLFSHNTFFVFLCRICIFPFLLSQKNVNCFSVLAILASTAALYCFILACISHHGHTLTGQV
jgi:hypothetical protein